MMQHNVRAVAGHVVTALTLTTMNLQLESLPSVKDTKIAKLHPMQFVIKFVLKINSYRETGSKLQGSMVHSYFN